MKRAWRYTGIGDSTGTGLHRVLLAVSLACLMGIFGSSCGKIKEMVNKRSDPETMDEPVEPEVPPEEAAKREELKRIARYRLEQLQAEAEPFDRLEAARELLIEKHQVDLDRLFPDGYDPDKLASDAQVKREIARRSEVDANRQYPPELKEQVAEQATKDHPLYEVGDAVKVRTRAGKTLDGEIERLTESMLEIDGFRVLIADVVEPDPSAFLPERNEKVRAVAVRKQYNIPRSDYKRARLKEITAQTYRDLGYVWDHNRWVRVDELIERYSRQLDDRQAEYESAQTAELRQQVETSMREDGLFEADLETLRQTDVVDEPPPPSFDPLPPEPDEQPEPDATE